METKKCPKCGATLVIKEKNGRKFYACPAFKHGCEGYIESIRFTRTVSDKKLIDLSTFKPSKRQLEIKDALLNTNRNLLIKSTAGSGKTVTAGWLTNFMDRSLDIAFTAFNKEAADSIYSRVPDGITTGTFHSICLKNFPYKRQRIDDDKVKNIIKESFKEYEDIKEEDPEQYSDITSHTSAICKMVGLIKDTLVDPNETENLKALCQKYHVEYDPDYEEWFFQAVQYVFWESWENMDVIDLDDMIFYVAIQKVVCRKYDIVLVDEFQDSNEAQFEVLKHILKPGGRLILIGDQNQSIYMFRGGYNDAMDRGEKQFNPLVLSLDVSFRNSKAIVNFVNKEFPYIPHHASENAVEGSVNENLKYSEFLRIVQDGDLVMCRNNAPLIKPVFHLIREGKKATIKGRDIGVGLKNKISSIVAKYHVDSIESLYDALEEYREREMVKLERNHNLAGIEKLNDDIETISALADESEEIDDMYARIDEIFSEDKVGIVFSTIHKAKGLEAPNSFVLRPDLMPSKMAATAEELQQEENMRFVAHTRGKINHYIIPEKY